MINFTWEFKITNTVPYDINTQNANIIKTLSWVLKATDEEYPNKYSMTSGAVDFKIESLPGFIDIKDVTNETLQSWIENVLGEERLNQMKTNLEINVNSLPNDWNPISNV